MNCILKEKLDYVYSICEKLNDSPLGMRIKSQMKTQQNLKEFLTTDLLGYLIYLKAPNTITESQSKFIKEYLGVDMPPEKVKMMHDAFKQQNASYRAAFEMRVPVSMKNFVNMDLESGKEIRTDSMVSGILFEVFIDLGNEFLGEKIASNTCLFKMKEFIESYFRFEYRPNI